MLTLPNIYCSKFFPSSKFRLLLNGLKLYFLLLFVFDFLASIPAPISKPMTTHRANPNFIFLTAATTAAPKATPTARYDTTLLFLPSF